MLAGVFERFTEGARQVVVLAQEEVIELGYENIGTELLLLGLTREERGLGARALEGLGVTVQAVRAAVARALGEGPGPVRGARQIPFTPEAKRALEIALREARSMGDSYIGTEHLLLGLAREESVGSAAILRDLGIRADEVRSRVRHLRLQAPPAERTRKPAAGVQRGHGRELDGPRVEVDATETVRRIWMSAAASALENGRTSIQTGDLLNALLADTTIESLLSDLQIDVRGLRQQLKATAWTEPDDPAPQPPAA
jgi:ATP-dependent Clp protease ATP-binding subunit ClpA